MKRKWLLLAIGILVLIAVAIVLKIKFFSKPGAGALQISATPKTAVYLDGNQLGVTPFFNDKITPGEHTVKLVPESTASSLPLWESKVQVTANILTFIDRELNSSEASSAGEVVTLDKSGKKNLSSIVVISVPDKAMVTVNDQPKNFTPLQIDDIDPGSYKVTVSSTGYRERTISINTIAGYKSTINVKLAQEAQNFEKKEPQEEEAVTPTPTAKETPSPKPGLTVSPTPKVSPQPSVTPPKPYVKVKETPTGFLRVRIGPSTGASEAAKILPGEMYPYLNEEENSWYKIEYEEDKEGWVSGTYIDLVE